MSIAVISLLHDWMLLIPIAVSAVVFLGLYFVISTLTQKVRGRDAQIRDLLGTVAMYRDQRDDAREALRKKSTECLRASNALQRANEQLEAHQRRL